jgi:uncharacterized membrane protein YesL
MHSHSCVKICPEAVLAGATVYVHFQTRMLLVIPVSIILGLLTAHRNNKYTAELACVAALGESRACTKPPALPFPPT